MRDLRVAVCAMAAKSCASCTEPEEISAQPVWRTGHHVLVVAEDGERLGGDGAGGHVEDGAGQFAGDLVHIGDHQQQALRGGEGGGQGAGLQRAVHSSRRAAFGLHLDHSGDGAPEVLFALGRPFVGKFTHVEEGVIG